MSIGLSLIGLLTNIFAALRLNPIPTSKMSQLFEGDKPTKQFSMQYTLKRLIDVDPMLCAEMKKRCYAINGCCATVHRELGPFLNEYMYQEALQILLDENRIPYEREYYFSIMYHGKQIQHKHFVDFLVDGDIIVECKAAEKLVSEHRQQLWNYMRLMGRPIGILYNFAPPMDQAEHYYLDTEKGIMYMF